jgi:hypothetical protein
MRQPSSPQYRFLLRASLAFIGLLTVWWLLLLPPLLGWTRISADVLLNAVPGAPLKSGVTVSPEGVWVIQAPVKVGGVWRNVRVEAGRRLPIQLTVGLPLFWAILLAAPRHRGLWKTGAAGSFLVLLIPPFGLLTYAAHVVQIYVFPGIWPVFRAALAAADYFASTAAPYLLPVLAALALHPELRQQVLFDDSLVPDRHEG